MVSEHKKYMVCGNPNPIRNHTFDILDYFCSDDHRMFFGLHRTLSQGWRRLR